MKHISTAIEVPLHQQTWDWQLDTSSGYLIVEADGIRLLIDTGSPLTICESEFEFGGRIQPARESYLAFSIDNVRQGVGVHVDALIGMDMLGPLDVRFDIPAQRIELHGPQVELQDTSLPIILSNTLPQLSMGFLHAPHANMIFDTGAPLSYLRRDLVGDAEIIAESEDFYPTFGRFSTPVCRLPYTAGAESSTGKFGVLPELLEAALLAQNIDGIIGSQLIANGVAVLATRRQRLDITFDSENPGSRARI